MTVRMVWKNDLLCGVQRAVFFLVEAPRTAGGNALADATLWTDGVHQLQKQMQAVVALPAAAGGSAARGRSFGAVAVRRSVAFYEWEHEAGSLRPLHAGQLLLDRQCLTVTKLLQMAKENFRRK